MGTILDTILADKREEVDAQKQRVSPEQLHDQLAGLPPCRPFAPVLSQPHPRGIHVIAEVKKASPSAGLIRPDFDPVAIARIYEQCGASAISVLTDEKYFQGRLEYLTAVKQAVSLPVMRKEFIVDPYQIVEARVAGADAILLIADCLSVEQLQEFMLLADKMGLGVLLEVYREDVLMQVRHLVGYPHSGANILGINNRDLTTMNVDLNHTGRLAAKVDGLCGLVGESGVKTRRDVETLMACGATAVLIGQTLCQRPDIAAAFGELFG